jgi:hypothetical protein
MRPFARYLRPLSLLSPLRTSRPLTVGSIGVGLLVAILLLASSPSLPITWDEGNAISRAEKVQSWLGVSDTGEAEIVWNFSPERIDQGWPYTISHEGHPAFYGLLIAAGESVAPRSWLPLTRWRLGPIVWFSIAIGAVFYRIGRQFSLVAALAGVGAILILPRLFAHAHLAGGDGPLAAGWLLAWAVFDPARRLFWGKILFGAALGATMSLKATGWILPIGFLVWACLYRDRKSLVALAWALPIGLLTFVLLNPPLWHDPIGGLVTFFDLNLHRAREGWDLSTWFLGQLYNIEFPLPWYNTLFWVGVTVPVGLLVLLIFGIGKTVARPLRSRRAMLVLILGLVLLVVRAIPGTPPHDGVRLFLPAFGFLGILAGIGAATLVGQFRRRSFAMAAATLVGLVYFSAAVDLVQFSPHWLSYYNRLIGGPAGAEAAGMEPTYYWDAITPETLDWLHQNTPPDENVRFACGPSDSLRLLQRWGLFDRQFVTDDSAEFRWYVVQNRPGIWQPPHWRLWKDEQLAYTEWLEVGRARVPLLKIYDRAAFERSTRSSTLSP